MSTSGAAPIAGADGSTLAALDIGTNSFHLVVARFSGDGHQFEVIEREKEMVRLGSGSGDMKLLEPDAIDRGIAALTRCRQIAEVHGARLYAVATSAVREAENADEFLRRARDEAGVEVEVVSGVEEARLIHLGVLQAVPVFDKRLLLVDIGGGSTEILVGERGEGLDGGFRFHVSIIVETTAGVNGFDRPAPHRLRCVDCGSAPGRPGRSWPCGCLPARSPSRRFRRGC